VFRGHFPVDAHSPRLSVIFSPSCSCARGEQVIDLFSVVRLEQDDILQLRRLWSSRDFMRKKMFSANASTLASLLFWCRIIPPASEEETIATPDEDLILPGTSSCCTRSKSPSKHHRLFAYLFGGATVGNSD